jgi:hypothetical protein
MGDDQRGQLATARLGGLLRWFTPAWIALSLAAVIWQVSLHWSEIVAQPLQPGVLALSCVLTLAAKFFSALQVRRSLQQSGIDIGERVSFYTCTIGDLAKYIPGGIWGLVSRVALYRQIKIGARTIARALVLEQIWLIGGATAMGLLVLACASANPTLIAGSIGLAVAWAACVVFLVWRSRTSPSVARTSLKLLGIQTALWTFAGLGFGCLLPDGFLRACGAFCLAFAAGLAVPFAPGGIGVREAVAGALVASDIALAEILRALLLSRLVWIVADTIFAGLVITTCRPAWTRKVARNGGEPKP